MLFNLDKNLTLLKEDVLNHLDQSGAEQFLKDIDRVRSIAANVTRSLLNVPVKDIGIYIQWPVGEYYKLKFLWEEYKRNNPGLKEIIFKIKKAIEIFDWCLFL